jgi:hypothetical protein
MRLKVKNAFFSALWRIWGYENGVSLGVRFTKKIR